MLALHHTFSYLLPLRFRVVYVSEVTLIILSDRPNRCICNHLLYLHPATFPLCKTCVEYHKQICFEYSYLLAKEKWAEALGEKFLGLS